MAKFIIKLSPLYAVLRKFFAHGVFRIATLASVPLLIVLAGFVWRQLEPFGMALPPLAGIENYDPNKPITLDAVGYDVRLASVELLDGDGRVLAEFQDKNSVTLPFPLAYGKRHTVRVKAERAWLGQSLSKEFSFTTAAVPQLEGPPQRNLGPNSQVTLNFDRPVGDFNITGELPVKVEADSSRRNFRLSVEEYAQGRDYHLQVDWATQGGVKLPPFELELSTSPPLQVETNVKGLANLGVALPLRVKFSEPLADRANTGKNIKITTVEGVPVDGKWEWQGQRQLQFTPKPSWPASSTIVVSIDKRTLKSQLGGRLDDSIAERFSTGTDRKILVFLATQRVEAWENGQLVRVFKVSTGKPATPTATGDFFIYDRYRHKTMHSDVPRGQKGFYEVENVPYTQFFHGDMAFHGAFWHNSFGHPASHGCVNMATKEQNTRWPKSDEDAGWLYQWASLGVPVTVMKESPIGQPEEPLQASSEKTAESSEKLALEDPNRKAQEAHASAQAVANP